MLKLLLNNNNNKEQISITKYCINASIKIFFIQSFYIQLQTKIKIEVHRKFEFIRRKEHKIKFELIEIIYYSSFITYLVKKMLVRTHTTDL